MDKIVSRIWLACIILLVFQLNQLNAQVKLSVTRVKFEKDTATLGSSDRLSVTVKNTGNLAFNGKIYIDYKSNGASGGTTPVKFDSTKAAVNFNANDTLVFSPTYFIIDQQNFRKGPNIVVVWPRANGVTAIDSGKTTIIVIDPLGISDVLVPENGFVLYPNPAYSRIYILPIDSKIGIENVRIFDNVGNLVKTLKCNNNLIDIDGLESGLYMLEIETTTHERFVKRFLRE
ncbi:MAG: T9SS type A sorting domain-containing protein [Bacteroidetes bacterium]|nr:T9SS type A sorting domain-containing protein [Bacteroidota bacterium]